MHGSDGNTENPGLGKRNFVCAAEWPGLARGFAGRNPVPDAEPCRAGARLLRGGVPLRSFGRLRRLWRAAWRGDSGAPEADCEGLRGWVRRQPGAGARVTPRGLRNVRKLWGYPRTHPLERLLGVAAERVAPPSRKGPAAAGGAIVRQIVKKFWNLPALRQSSPTEKLQTHCALSRKNALTCKCLKTC